MPQLGQFAGLFKRRNPYVIDESGGYGGAHPLESSTAGTIFPPPQPDVNNPMPSRLQKLEGDMSAMDAHPSKKGTLLRAIAAFAPVAAGAAFGGLEGASGATEGVLSSQQEQQAAQALKRKTLQQQIDAERQRQFQTSERLGEQGFRSGERQAGETFTAGQNDTNRTFQSAEADKGRSFTAGQNAEDRTFRTNERVGGETFTAGQSKLQRDMQQALQNDQQGFLSGEADKTRGFQSGEAEKTRGFQRGERLSTEGFTAGQNNLNRSLQRDMVTAKANGGAAASSQATMIDKALDTIGQLEKDTGWFSGQAQAVGFKGPVGTFTGPLPGTAAADYTAYINQLKSALTLPNLSMMRGLGAMSDREFNTVSSAVTSLSPDMSETAFNQELAKIKEGLLSAQARGGVGGGSASPEYDFVPGKGIVRRQTAPPNVPQR